MFETTFVEKIKSHFMLSNFLYENRSAYEIIWEKYDRAGQATNDMLYNACALPDR